MQDYSQQFETMLQGGDLRSLGQAAGLIPLINSQEAFDALIFLVQKSDGLIAMRASDVIEKISLQHPFYLMPHKAALLQICKSTPYAQVKWHLALILPRIHLTKKEIGMLWEIFTNWAMNVHESRIVRVNAVQGMYELLKQFGALRLDFDVTINEIYRENIPSLNARIRMLRKAKY